jgi:uncharacterized protein involved in exopolysaccharide biosynthesis
MALFLFKHLRLISMVVVLVTGVTGLLVYYVIPQTYWAKGVVLIERGKSPTLRSDLAFVPGDMDSAINSEIEIAQSRGVVEQVVDRLGLDKREEKVNAFRRISGAFTDFLDRVGLLPKVDKRERVIRSVLNNIEVKQPARSDLLSISFAADDPKYATEVSHALIDAYIDKHRAIFTDNTASFFDARLKDTENSLSKLRERLQLETEPSRGDELKLEVKALEAAYLLNRDKRDRARSASTGDESLVNIRVVDYPSVPVRPSLPRLILLLAAFGASLVLAICLALLRGYFDHMVYSPADLPADLDMPLVSSVRQSRAGKLGKVRAVEKRLRKLRRRTVTDGVSDPRDSPDPVPLVAASTLGPSRTAPCPAGPEIRSPGPTAGA